MTLPAPPDVVGHSLSGTDTYSISTDENAALCASIGCSPAEDGSAHPSYYYTATQVGMGETVAGLCEVCEFDVEVGPMMAGSQVEFHAPILCDEPYTVEGEITSIVRKQSRKLGVMDIMSYQLRLVAKDGSKVLTTNNSWVLPRRELA